MTKNNQRKILSVTFAAIFALAMVAISNPATADEQMSSSGAPLEGPQFQLLAAPIPVDCNVDSNVIAWSTDNGASVSDYLTIATDLENRGFTIREVNIAGEGDVIPECIVKLVLSSQNGGLCINTDLPAATDTAIVNWVSSGGELLVLEEYGGCGGGFADITSSLGATWNGNTASDFAPGETYDNTEFDETHPIMNGVTSYDHIAGTDFTITGDLDPVTVDSTNGLPVMVAGNFDSGCVVITGDSDWMGDVFIVNNDNQIVANNVFTYINGCTIQAEKSWTHTDYNWDPVCDGVVIEEICYDNANDLNEIGFRPANINVDEVLADPLDQDANDKYLAFAQLHKNGKFSNTNPGAFYALTTVEIIEDLDSLVVDEIYGDCTGNVVVDGDGQIDLQLISPNGKPERAVKVAVADPNGDVTELTDDLYDGTGGSITADIDNAEVQITDSDNLIAGSTAYILVKFQDNLKGLDTDGDFDGMCNNVEDVTSNIGAASESVSAEASLRITNLE